MLTIGLNFSILSVDPVMTPFRVISHRRIRECKDLISKLLLVHYKILFSKFLVAISNKGKRRQLHTGYCLWKSVAYKFMAKIYLYCLWLVCLWLFLDLGRMYNLVARIPDGLGQLRTLLENHITSQGLNALEKCGDQAFNVSVYSILCYLIFVITIYSYMILYINFRELPSGLRRH